ncbi:MAG: hypothetical protein GF384_02565, partial [Elusimicrobia bacterium]|nr:hypothetical protein [Elusimicrobiota bacterium]
MKTYPLEQLAASFIEKIVKTIPQRMEPVVFASPLCARSSDMDLLWHPGYASKHQLYLVVRYVNAIVWLSIKSFYRIIKGIRPLAYARYGKNYKSLFVMPSMTGYYHAESNTMETNYLERKSEEGLLVFGEINTCGPEEKMCNTMTIGIRIAMLYLLLIHGVRAWNRIRAPKFKDSFLILCSWINWCLRWSWIHDYYLGEILKESIEQYRPKQIGCLHEMHFYSRLVWWVAAQYGIKTSTVQHAGISEGKRWYFSYPEEWRAGLQLPSVMYVYHHSLIELLKP